MKIPRWWLELVVAVGFAAISGCGGKDTFPTQGVVTLDGKPLEGAVVQARPQTGGGKDASAVTRSDGTFELQTGQTKGVARGTYSITITKFEAPKPGEYKGRSSLPADYSSPQSTPFKNIGIPHDGPLKLELRSGTQGKK